MKHNSEIAQVCGLIAKAREPKYGPDGKKLPPDFRADNSTILRGLCLHFNFIEVPDPDGILTTPTTVLTLSVIKNHRRCIGLEKKHFAKLMNYIEGTLQAADVMEQYDFPYYLPLYRHMPHNDLCGQLGCHRMFFIPTAEVRNVEYALCGVEHIARYNGEFKLMEVSAVFQMQGLESSTTYYTKKEDTDNYDDDDAEE